MSRRIMTVAVMLISLTAGACVGSLQAKRLPIEIVNEVAPAQPEPALIHLKALAISELFPPAPDTPAPLAPRCERSAQILNAEKLLATTHLKVGTKEYRYTEKRAGGSVAFSDPEKQIALELLDAEDCALSQVVITKRGDKLIAPPGYHIEVVTRANGIRWNNWATEYRVTKPAGLTVIANKYPLVQGRTVTMVFYTPYSKELHVPEMVTDGRGYLTDLAARAYEDLRRLKVPSETEKNKLVVDVSALKPEFNARLVPNELMDMTEFTLDPTWTTERIHVVIGANRDRVASFTCSKAKACGLMQFTAGTYALMAKVYPGAKLNADFVKGARDPLNAMKAAVLLHDYNLAILINAFGSGISRDPNLEEYLAAAYNTGVGRVRAVLAVAQRTKAADWAQANGKQKNEHLLGETKGYIAKLRYLRDQWPLPPLARVDTTTPDR